jgi:hypothetical protein
MRDTIEMAGEVWQSGTGRYTGTASIGELQRFEALVRADERKIVMNEPLTKEMWQRFEDEIRADEREACAKFCETHQVWVGQGKRGFSEWGEDEFVTGGIHQGMDYAAAIRARGETE